LPPSRAEWLAALYSHVERRLSRKTGITIDGFHFKGENLLGLIDKHGEQRYLHVLYNRDDFREVYIYEGDDVPLIELKNELATEETPAYSFAEAKEKLKKHRAGFKPAPQAEKFDHDLHQEIMSDAMAPKRKRPSRRQQNQETKARTRETEAVKRAAQRPAPPLHPSTQPSHTAPSAAPLATGSFADMPPLAMLNRNSGEELI
jgi:putative transposase